MPQVRVSEKAKQQVDELVKFSNEKKDHTQPKYTQEVWLNELIDMKHKRSFGA